MTVTVTVASGPMAEVAWGAPGDLCLAESHWWGTVRTPDGWTACPTRSGFHDPARPGRRLLLNTSSPQGLVLDRAGAATGSGSPLGITVDDAVCFTTPEGRWWIELASGVLRWHERDVLHRDVLHLDGTAIGPTITWALPGIRYSIDIFSVAGTVLGRTVEGFIGFDQICLPPGHAFYTDDPLAKRGLLVAMLSFANRFEDGRVEGGAFGVGHEGWRFGAVHRTGLDPIVTTDVDAAVHRIDGYWPDRIDVRLGGENWCWEGREEGRFVGYGRLKNPQVDGLFRRMSGSRRPTAWFAQGETVPDHGDRPRHGTARRASGSAPRPDSAE